MRRIGVLHVLIVACFGLFALKAADVYSNKRTLEEVLLTYDTLAEESPENSKKEDDEGGHDTAEDNKIESVETKKEDTDHAKEESKETPGEEKGQGEKEKDEEKPKEEVGKSSGEGEVKDIRKELTFTEIEVEILKRLQQRREKLEKWEENLRVKDSVLKVTQTKIDQKLQELRDLKKNVEALLAQYNEKEDTKIRSLVKIYENMKPKDAAKIFEGLEMDVLLQVVDKMKEAKTAPILAKMSPEKAKQLTVLFAEQKKLVPKTE